MRALYKEQSLYQFILKPAEAEDIDIFHLSSPLLRRWKFIFVCGFISGVLGIAVALYLPSEHKSELLIFPNDSPGAPQSGSSLGSLGSLAGINLGGEMNQNSILVLEKMKSQHFINNFISKYDILVPLMAGEKWVRDPLPPNTKVI